jgi:hypothetical protein
MSQFCRPKKRTTFRRWRMSPGNQIHLLFYPDPNMKWKMIRSMGKAQNAVTQEKAS